MKTAITLNCTFINAKWIHSIPADSRALPLDKYLAKLTCSNVGFVLWDDDVTCSVLPGRHESSYFSEGVIDSTLLF